MPLKPSLHSEEVEKPSIKGKSPRPLVEHGFGLLPSNYCAFCFLSVRKGSSVVFHSTEVACIGNLHRMNTIGTFSLRSLTLSFRRNLNQELESQNSTFVVNKPPPLVAVIPGPLYPLSLLRLPISVFLLGSSLSFFGLKTLT